MRGKKTTHAQIDLGLAILAATSTPPHSLEEIAAYCGVSWQAIQSIEQRALRKLRHHFYCQQVKSLSDLMKS